MIQLLENNLIITLTTNLSIYIVLLLLTLLVLTFILGYVLSVYRYKKVVHSNIEKESYNKSLKILDAAKKQSLKIYGDAHKKSKKIIEHATKIATKQQDAIQEDLEKVRENQLKEYDQFLIKELKEFKSMVDTESDETTKAIHQISKEIQKDVSSTIDQFKQTLLEETVGSQKVIDDKVKNEYDQVHNEIISYRDKKFQEIDDQVAEIVVDVATKSLNKSFSANEHKQIILSFLQDAKAKSLLNAD